MSRRLLAFALCLSTLLPAILEAAETAETILIRAALGKDLTGRRRGNAELMADACSEEHFVTYDGANSASGAGWTPQIGDRDSYEEALNTQLAASRFDIERAVVFINVWKNKAFVTTVDSGLVIDRQSGSTTPYYDRRLWTFAKNDEQWLSTGFISAYGDTTAGAVAAGIEDERIAQALRDEADNWNSGSASGIASAVAEEFVAVESKFSANPALWLIVFADREEYSEWLDDRLSHVDYTVDRQVLHVAVGADGEEAVAVTRDQVKAAHVAGDAVDKQERVTYWLLTREGGDWVASWAFWKSKDLLLTPTDGTASLH